MLFTERFGGSGVRVIDEQIMAVSGFWLKVAAVRPMDLVVAELWGGGAAGSHAYQGGTYDVNLYGEGGFGGTYVCVMLRAYMLAASEAVGIGAGGLPRTTPYPTTGGATLTFSAAGSGGDTTFAGMIAKGGGGATLRQTTTGISANDAPAHARLQDFGRVHSLGNGTPPTAALTFAFRDPIIELSDSSVVRFSGAKGGNILKNGSGQIAPGTTKFGGAGGVSRHNVAGQDGFAPGGGGGGSSLELGGGIGARGEVRVKVLRGL